MVGVVAAGYLPGTDGAKTGDWEFPHKGAHNGRSKRHIGAVSMRGFIPPKGAPAKSRISSFLISSFFIHSFFIRSFFIISFFISSFFIHYFFIRSFFICSFFIQFIFYTVNFL